MRQHARHGCRNESRLAAVGALLPREQLAIAPELNIGAVVNLLHIAPGIFQARHGELFAHAAHFVLIGNDIHLQPHDLLGKIRVVEAAAEEAVGRNQRLLARSEFVGTLHEFVHSHNSGIGEYRSQTVLHGEIPAIESIARAI